MTKPTKAQEKEMQTWIGGLDIYGIIILNNIVRYKLDIQRKEIAEEKEVFRKTISLLTKEQSLELNTWIELKFGDCVMKRLNQSNEC